MSELVRDKDLIEKLVRNLREDKDYAFEHLYNMVSSGMITLSEFVTIIQKIK